MKRLIPLLALSAALLFPIRASAQIPVTDVASIAQQMVAYAEQIQQLEQEYQQVSQLTSANGWLTAITGLNGQIQAQIGTITGGSTSFLTGGSGGRTSGSLTQSALSQLGLSSQGLGINPDGTLGSIYMSAGPFSGSLDVFMGSNATNFQANQGNPLQAYYQYGVNSSMASLGAAAGATNNEISFAANVALMDPSTRRNNEVAIANGYAELTSQNYMGAGENRRQAIQAESNLATSAANRATNSTSANETASATAELAASQARMEAIHAQQANLAAEAQVLQGDATNHLLSDMDNNAAREQAEALLAKKAAGNN